MNVSTIGETIEGRPIQAVKISHGGVGNPIIVLDGGIHAREWIAPATVLYVLQQLVENPENFPMFRKVDWILIPMLNPDGYVYSMTKVGKELLLTVYMFIDMYLFYCLPPDSSFAYFVSVEIRDVGCLKQVSINI